MFRAFIRVQRLKRAYPPNFENINYGRVFATQAYTFGLLDSIKRIIYAIFFEARVLGEGGSGWLVIYSLEHKRRADFDNSVSLLMELIPSESRLVKVSDRFSIFAFLGVARHMPEACREVRLLLPAGLYKFSMILLVAKYKCAFHSFSLARIVDECAGLITFCDAMPYDNLLTQMASKQKIKTMTCQHGQYRRLGLRNMSPDAEAYKNFISDKLLCWGGATVAEFLGAGIPESRLLRVGRLTRQHKIDVIKKKYESFGVLLNGENGKFSNPALIEMANLISERLGIGYFIRPHPANNLKEYEGLLGSGFRGYCQENVEAYVAVADFSLAHMTGLTVDLLRSGHRVYIIDDGFLADVFRVEMLSFSAVDDLLSVIAIESLDFERRSAVCAKCYSWFNEELDQGFILGREVGNCEAL